MKSATDDDISDEHSQYNGCVTFSIDAVWRNLATRCTEARRCRPTGRDSFEIVASGCT